jgi:hypothetical protein
MVNFGIASASANGTSTEAANPDFKRSLPKTLALRLHRLPPFPDVFQ